MGIIDALAKRRSYYRICKDLPVSREEVADSVKRVAELVPDAFNMKSARVAVVFGEKHDRLWDTVFDVFGGKVAREKIDGFRAGAGTVLFFVDEDTVRSMHGQYPRYAGNFPVWAQQANGMLQICVWARLREMGIGANIQHYKPLSMTP